MTLFWGFLSAKAVFDLMQCWRLFFGLLIVDLPFGRQEEHLVCKHWVMRCWCGYLSGARCRLFAYGPADATASQNPSYLASFKSRMVSPFWYWLTQVVLENRLLNGCSSSSSSLVCWVLWIARSAHWPSVTLWSIAFPKLSISSIPELIEQFFLTNYTFPWLECWKDHYSPI